MIQAHEYCGRHPDVCAGRIQGRHPVLSIDDEELFIRLLQLPDARAVGPRLKAQFLRREKQDGARNGRLRDGRLIKVADGADFRAGQFPLERLVVALDFGNELRDVILFLDLVGNNLAALFIVEPADEADTFQQMPGRIRGKIKQGILLPDLCRDHKIKRVSRAGFEIRVPESKLQAQLSDDPA